MGKALRRLFRHLLGDFFVRQILKHKRKSAAVVAVHLSQAIVLAITPLPLKFLFDQVLVESATPQFPTWVPATFSELPLLWILGLTVVLWAFFYFSEIILSYLELLSVTRLSNSLTESGRKEMTDLLLTRNQFFFKANSRADIVGRLSQDTMNMQFMVQTGMPLLVRSIPSITLMLGVLGSLSGWYVAIGSLKIAVLIWLTYHLAQKIRLSRRLVRKETTHFEQNGLQFLNSFQTVKSLGLEGHVRKKSARFGRAVSHRMLEAANGEGLIRLSFGGGKGVFRFLVYFIGGIAIISGHETVGTVILLKQYIDNIHYAMKDFYKFAYKSASSFASLDRLQEFLDEANTMPGPVSGSLACASGSLSVEFRDVSFAFSKESPLFQNYSQSFSAGSVNVVLGASGAGKSTFLCLFNRLFEPAHGRVLVHQKSLPEYDLRFLRGYVSYTPQESHIISGSIRDNLSFMSKRQIDENRLWEALRGVGGEEFVRSLPQGLDTVIGESGHTLSPGQERKINLARAFVVPLRGIYVFDEPTAGLDPLSAGMFMQKLKRLSRQGAIVFFSTHLAGEIAYADCVLEIKNQEIHSRSKRASRWHEQPSSLRQIDL